MTITEILTKLQRYCAYQDRCTHEVMLKLRTWQIDEDTTKGIVQQLKKNGFINDERYVQSFIRGKMGLKQWGKQKIKLGLLQKGIDKNLIDKYIETINQNQYRDNLQTAIRKWTQSHGPITNENKPKLYRHLLSKGFTYEEIKGMGLGTRN